MYEIWKAARNAELDTEGLEEKVRREGFQESSS